MPRRSRMRNNTFTAWFHNDAGGCCFSIPNAAENSAHLMLRSLRCCRHKPDRLPHVRPQWLSTRVTDPYAVLGLPHGATEDRVKRAYYKLALRLHPDRHPGTPYALQRFTEVGDAYTAIQGGAGGQAMKCRSEHAEELERMEQAPHVDAFPPWAHRLAIFLHHAGGERLDRWLMPSYSRIVYERVKAGELTEAFDVLEEMKGEGEVPSHAVYEMRGCRTLNPHRPRPRRPRRLAHARLQANTRLYNCNAAGRARRAGGPPHAKSHRAGRRAVGGHGGHGAQARL